MPLKITKAIEPIEVTRTTLCLYSVPGIGKTSIASTAEKPLLLDFDHGAHRTKYRKDTVRVEKWEDVASVTQADLAPYKTVIVDTAGRALDILSQKLIAENSKFGMGGALTLKGFGQLKSEFIGWLRMLNGYGLDVILLCHSDEQRNGDELIERLDMQGGSKNEIYKSADVMGRLYLEKGKRILNFSPTDTSFGKNPAALPPIEIPDFALEPAFLAGVIATIKAKLNDMSVAQVEAQQEQEEWAGKFAAAETAELLTAFVPVLETVREEARKKIQLILVHVAKGKGFTWDKTASKFIAEPKTEAKP